MGWNRRSRRVFLYISGNLVFRSRCIGRGGAIRMGGAGETSGEANLSNRSPSIFSVPCICDAAASDVMGLCG